MTDEQRQALSALLNIDLQTASSERLIELCLLYRASPDAAESFPQALRDEIKRRYDAGTIAADDVTYAVLQRFANDLPASIPRYKALLQDMAAAPNRDLWLAAHELDIRTAIQHPEIATWLTTQTAILQKCLASPLALEWMAQSAPMAAAIFADNGAISLWQSAANLWDIWPRYTPGMRVLAQVPAQVSQALGNSMAASAIARHSASLQTLLHFPSSRTAVLAHEGFIAALADALPFIMDAPQLPDLMKAIVNNPAARKALVKNNPVFQNARHRLYDMVKQHWEIHISITSSNAATLNDAIFRSAGLVFACLSVLQPNSYSSGAHFRHPNSLSHHRDVFATKTLDTSHMAEVTGITLNGASFSISNGSAYCELWIPK